MTEPAPRNNWALKNPCTNRWKIAKVQPMGPKPAPNIMYPIWDMVEAASTFFISSLAQPTIAPNSKVIAPTIATQSWAVGEATKISPERTIKYTPAVTIVAAWIRADTGVGPAIASPSQACSGNCADLPQAASSKNRPMAVAQPPVISPEREAPSTSTNFMELNSAYMDIMASSRPRSPTRFITKAFLAATALGSS